LSCFKEDDYGELGVLTIRNEYESRTGDVMPLVRLYSMLDRLVGKELLTKRIGDPNRPWFFKITDAGIRLLEN